jgi:hypothetical protein
MAQGIEIVGILVAAGNRQHPSAQDIRLAVDDAALVARIGNAGGEPIGNPHLPLGLTEQQHAAVRRQPAAVKGSRYFLATNGWKAKAGSVIIAFGRCGLWHFLPRGRTGLDTHIPTAKQRLTLHSPTRNHPAGELSGLD